MNAPAPPFASPRQAEKSLRPLLAGLATDIPELGVCGLALDSREIERGFLFLAVRGSRAHGLAHIEEALAHGAAAVAWEPAPGIAAPEFGIPCIAVEELSRKAGIIAARFYDDPSSSLFVSGVTGTDGKTSTAHLIAQAFDRLGMPSGYLGTLGSGQVDALEDGSLTTPDAIAIQHLMAGFRNRGLSACAMEVSSHALDQQRIAGVHFSAVALTNVGRDHLDYHGTIEAYAAAKRSLFTDCAPGAIVLNRDDEYGRRWAADLITRGNAARLRLYGIGGEPPAKGQWLIAEGVETRANGLFLCLRSSEGDLRIKSRLLGRFNAHNLMAALGVLLARGVPLVDAGAALAEARTVPGRMEAFSGARFAARVVVDYAHTPQALAHALSALRPHVQGRLICVFGCGGDRDRGKRPLMGAAAASGADVAIVTDDNPRGEDPAAIVADILSGVANPAAMRVEHDRARAIESAVRGAGMNDLVLVAGKGHENYQIVGSAWREFSDRAFVANLLGAPERAK